jgi:hydrogenase maturation factor
MSVVADAMTAIGVGIREEGVTAMHDATECGIWGGLYELAQAAGLGMLIDKEAIVVEDCVSQICNYFGIDPYASISEGTLIMSCKEHKAQAVVAALAEKDIKSSVVGELVKPESGMVLISNGIRQRLEHPIVDPFWNAFYEALRKYAPQKT